MSKVTWSPGDVFSVPVGGVGTSLAVIARQWDSGYGLLAYFYLPSSSGATRAGELLPEAAELVARCSGLYLKYGRWSVVARINPWVPAEWPVPAFEFVEPLTGTVFNRIYDESSMDAGFRQVRVESRTPGMPEDGLYGSGAVERKLSRLAGVEPPPIDRDEVIRALGRKPKSPAAG